MILWIIALILAVFDLILLIGVIRKDRSFLELFMVSLIGLFFIFSFFMRIK